jgi:anaerobic magnesium-protoporphyrin IX monomethyl ester cyclase
MKICLINPSRLLKPISTTQKSAPPLGLAFIASSLKAAGNDVQVIDCIAEASDAYYAFNDDVVLNGLTIDETLRLVEPGTVLIGLSLMFSGNWLYNRQLIDYLGAQLPGVKIIAGGEHVTACPEYCLSQTRHLDVCVLGEGEETVVDLVRCIAAEESLDNVDGIVYRDTNEEIIVNKRRTRVVEINAIPRPAWELFPLRKYVEHDISYGVIKNELSLPVMATRGCPYTCTFCSSPNMWGTRYYMRSPGDVIDEIQYFKDTYGATNFDFFDLTAIIKRDWIIEFSREIVKREINITWQIPAGTRAEAIDDEVARYLFLSGCRNISYAPESGSPEILKQIKKKVVLANMLRSISHSHKEGMNVKLNMMIGFPGEKHRHILETIMFLIKASWYGANDMCPAPYSPYPGSQLFDELSAQGKIDLNNDKIFMDIINSDTLFDNKFYNPNLSYMWIRAYLILYFVVFYSSNYIFYPRQILQDFA